MAMLFGRFEIQSEISKSDTALIYRATDTQTKQIVALKTQSLKQLGPRLDAFVDALIAEGESTRDLVSQNIVALYGAGEIDGQFCAAMEHIQGNSVAGMLARKEGFSIWDLLDITRQVCAGLEHAAAKGVKHNSLEPSKIMVQWDGMVKILGYGISNMSLIQAECGNGLGRLMPYCSPEQIRGEGIDLRSNLFSLGTMLYEMVAGRRAFEADDPVELLNQIENEMPDDPSAINKKVQAGVSAVIMRALAKDPGERYGSARELLDELEKCKDSGKKESADAKPAAAAAAAATRFGPTSAGGNKFASAPVKVAKPAAPVVAAGGAAKAGYAPTGGAEVAATKAASTFAGAGGRGEATGVAPAMKTGNKSKAPGEFSVSAEEFQAARAEVMSAAVVDTESVAAMPRIQVDPAMAGVPAGASGVKFSDLAEMPPLKESYFPAPVVTPEVVPVQAEEISREKPAKQTLADQKLAKQSRELAEGVWRQVATIPPKLVLFSILGAVALILAVAIAVFFHVRSEDDDMTAAPRPVKTGSKVADAGSGGAGSTAGATATSTAASTGHPATSAPANSRTQAAVPAIAPEQPKLDVRQVKKSTPNRARRPVAATAAAVPVVLPGQATIDSNPQGAQFQVDGKSDPSWVTPFTVSDLAPGKHIIAVSKSGYSSEVRSVDVASSSKSSLVLHLAPVNALMVVNSTPAGAEITIDGKPTGRVTPSQFAVEKGSHTVLLHKQGYLDENTAAELSPAQNFQYAPTMKALGDVTEMRTVGRFNKLRGHGGDTTAGMGSISVHTQPKGAQVAINQRILDKLSPVDVMLGPGNYVVDVTLTGFKPVHKILTVDKGGKASVDEVLERQ